MKIGLVGFPGSGKSTVFNALTGLSAETGYGAARPGTKNLGVVRVPDSRLDRLAELYNPKKTTYAEVTFCDIAGGAGERSIDRGVLNAMREMDALCQVLRAFDNPALTDAPNPARELADMQVETILADLDVAERRLARLRKERGDPNDIRLMEKLVEQLEAERPLRALELDAHERKRVSGYQFLSLKPLLLVLNVVEDAISEPVPGDLVSAAEAAGTGIVALSAQLEMEIAQLPEEERGEMQEALEIQETARERFLKAAFRLLGLMTMFTVGPDECRSWPVRRGSLAPAAGGKIHSDIEQGFIRAEVTRWDDLLELGSEARCREAGKLKVEGRNYEIQDGDVAHFRFNV
jgi:GTP-binding protein YchF